MKELRNTEIAVVGLGLMGGSIAGALQGRCRSVVGIGRRESTIEAAIERGLVDRATDDLASGVREADVVILATPVRTIMQQIREVIPLLSEGALLMDLGSTKVEIMKEMDSLPEHVQPVGGHPMCGKEESGIGVAESSLYEGCTFILTPLPRTSETALALARELVAAVGARPLELNASRHDFLLSPISHLPYLLSCSLVETADVMSSPDGAAWEIVAGGFRDTSRLAGSDVRMLVDTLCTNQNNVKKALETCQEQLHQLALLVERADEGEMEETLSAIREKRRQMFS